MNSFFYNLAKPLKFISLQHLIRVTGQHIVFPFYHTVSDKTPIHIKNLYRVRSAKEFTADLEFFLKHYEPIDFHELLNRKNSKKNCFLLSFDDGLREFYDVIAPILRQKGIPAICFLNSKFIDNKALFYRYKASLLIEELKSDVSVAKEKELQKWFEARKMDFKNKSKSILAVNYQNQNELDELASILEFDFPDYLRREKPYLETAQIRELIDQGFHFGAHSVDHPLYSEITEEEQIAQTLQSVQEITSMFGLNYRLFSFPFSDDGVSGKFFKTIFNSQNPVADFTFGTAGLKKDSYKRNFHRIPFEIENVTAQEIVYAQYLYYMAKVVFNKNKIMRK